MSKLSNEYERSNPGLRREHFKCRAIKARISKEIKVRIRMNNAFERN